MLERRLIAISSNRQQCEISAFVLASMRCPLHGFSRTARQGLSLAISTCLAHNSTLAFDLCVGRSSISDCGAMIRSYQPSDVCRNRRISSVVQYWKLPSRSRTAMIQSDVLPCVKDVKRSWRAWKKDTLAMLRHQASTDPSTSFCQKNIQLCPKSSYNSLWTCELFLNTTKF